MAKVHEVKKRIIDIRALMHGHGTGVDIYCRQLLKALFKIDTHNQYILYYNSWKPVKNIFPDISKYPNVEIIHTRIPNKILNACIWLFKWPQIDRLITVPASIFFMPDLRPIALKKTPLITTFHDLSMLQFPQFFSWKTRIWHKIFSPKKIAEQSKKIMSVSHFTEKELKRLLKVSNKKIVTSYEGPGLTNPDISETIRKKTLKEFNIKKPFFVSLSSIEPRKNLERLIKAFKLFHSKNSEYQLVIIGRKNKIFENTELSSTKGIIITGYVSEEEKSALLAESYCLVYPSLYEGFGLPILEAYQHQKPVIASNCASLPEVVGSGGKLCDPYDIESIAESLSDMTHKKTYKQYQSAIEAHLKQFSWEKAAEDLLRVMDAISSS